MEYDMNITAKGEDIHKKLADDEKNINYKNLLFQSGSPVIDNYDFFKRFCTLYDFLIELLSEKISLNKAVIEQNEMIKKVEELRGFVLLRKKTLIKKKVKVL